jgi:2-polyprenyl-6-hydroxyphenyl methylase/3-demethylubiquinone-9 3-methyltransferase
MSTDTTTTEAVTALKRQHRDTWADGDYPAVAEHIADAPPAAVLEAVDVVGRRLLDVATGSGNLAIEAAAAGATVTGLDLVDELLDVARDRAEERGLAIEWVEGDAEALPFPDDRFDVVTSIFGVQFAPRSEVVASELVRVCRPGGTIVLVNWTPGGLIGQLFQTMGRHMPPPPAFVTPPPKWGDEAHLRGLFGSAGDVQLTYGMNPFTFDSLDGYMDFFEVNYGPTKRAKEKLQAEGRWDALRDDLRNLYTSLNTAGDGTLHIDAEFVVCRVQLAG